MEKILTSWLRLVLIDPGRKERFQWIFRFLSLSGRFSARHGPIFGRESRDLPDSTDQFVVGTVVLRSARMNCSQLCKMLKGLLVAGLFCSAAPGDEMLELNLRVQKRVLVGAAGQPEYSRVERSEAWSASETAVIVCDVWDRHHCLNAVRRMEEFLPRLNQLLASCREQGVVVIHAPSDCMPAYENHPARRRAQQTPRVDGAREDLRFWCSAIAAEEHALWPIDQSDGGEDDDPQEHAEWAEKLRQEGRNPGLPWQAQHPLVTIDPQRDYISDRGDEVHQILVHRRLKNVILAGVHTNMCVLGRPFGLRQQVQSGMNVALVRDLTDSMYNPERWPWVDHFTGHDLVISHVERFVCPTITSDQILGGQPHRSAMDLREHRDVMQLPAAPGSDRNRAQSHWATVAVPGAWQTISGGQTSHFSGVAWIRSTIRSPARWLAQPVQLVVPATPSVRCWVNGISVQNTSTGVFAIPAEALLEDGVNLLVLRIEQQDSESLLAAEPLLRAGSEKLSLAGRWQLRTGAADDESWWSIPLPAQFGLGPDVLFQPSAIR